MSTSRAGQNAMGNLSMRDRLEALKSMSGFGRADFNGNSISEILNEGDFIILINGGHGFKMLEETEIIEVKQGPYSLARDKIKFNKVDEKQIKIK